MNINILLLELKKAVEASTFTGDFLLSVNKFSHRWIFIDELWRNHNGRLIRDILKVIFANFWAEYGAITVFSAASFTGTSEEELPIYAILLEAVESLGIAEVKPLRMVLESPSTFEPKGALLPGKYVGVFAMSVHVELIKSIIDVLQSRGCEVVGIVTIIEREQFSRKELANLGLEVVPMIVFDEASAKYQTTLEMLVWPYRQMHRYFKEREQ